MAGPMGLAFPNALSAMANQGMMAGKPGMGMGMGGARAGMPGGGAAGGAAAVSGDLKQGSRGCGGGGVGRVAHAGLRVGTSRVWCFQALCCARVARRALSRAACP
jgi:hypothetical protein